MTTATVPADHLDLANAPVIATLTTIGSSGYPQSSAVWFIHEDGVFRTSLVTERQKYKNLVKNPKATFFIINPENVFQTLEVRGDVTIEPDDDHSFVRHIFAHYGTSPEQINVPMEGRVKVTLTPTRIRTNS